MPTIPQSQIPQVQRAVAPVAAPDLAGEVAPYRGQAAIGQSLQNVGAVAEQFAVQSMRAKAEADLARGELAMQRTWAELQAELEAEKDTDKWGDLTNAALERASGEIFVSKQGASMAPAVRDQLNQQFAKWSMEVDTGVRFQAQRQRNRENDEALAQAQGMAVEQGDLEEAERLVGVRQRVGLISDTRAQLELANVRQGVDRQAVAKAINDDPHAAVALLEETTEGGRYRHFKNLSETDRLTALRSAKNARETARAEVAQSLSEDIYAGGTRAFGIDQRIDDAVEAGRILPSQGKNLKRLARGDRSVAEQAAAGAQLWQQALDLDKADPDYIQKAMVLRAQLHELSPEVKRPVLEVLDEKDGPEDVKEDVRNVYAALQRDFRANTFGNAQTWTQGEINQLKASQRRKLGNPMEGDPKDRAAFEKASMTLFRYQKAMRQWLQAHPDATVDEIQAYRASLTATERQVDLSTMAVDDLTGFAP